MFREIVKTKIKNLVITDTIQSEENIIVLDADIVDLIDTIEHEIVHIFNITNGYDKDVAVLRAPRGSSVVCLHVNSSDEGFIQIGDSITLLVHGHVETRLVGKYQMNCIDYQNRN